MRYGGRLSTDTGLLFALHIKARWQGGERCIPRNGHGVIAKGEGALFGVGGAKTSRER